MRVKICGLSKKQEVKSCVRFGADFCGFILNYKKSHRYINYKKAKELTCLYKGKSKFVGVLVNPNKDELQKFSKLKIDYFQIYGNFSKNEVLKIKKKYKKKIIYALQIKKKRDVFKYKEYMKVADIILWDSSGLNKSLSWNFNWIKLIPKKMLKMIAGNINIKLLKKLSNLADIVDVSGALETNKVKDIGKIKNFLSQARMVNNEN
jgi:phosphoribosylanthranilate isomerase